MYFFGLSFFIFLFFYFSRTRVTSLLLSIAIPFALMNVYFQGADWVNYLDFFNSPSLNDSPEILFYGIIFLFKKITLYSFEYTILIFYVLIFLSLYNLFYNKKHVLYCGVRKYYILFLSVFVLSLGPTLIVEQLRQLLALVLFMYALSELNNNCKLKAIGYLLFAMLSHVSAVVLFFVAFFCFSRISKGKFIVYTLMLCSFLFLLIRNPVIVYLNLSLVNYVYEKISRYLSVAQSGFGILHALYFLYAMYYVVFYRDDTCRRDGVLIFSRLAFSGAVLYLLSSILPFLNRFSSYFVVIYVMNFIFLCARCKPYRVSVHILISGLIIMSTGISYYRNPISPLPFFGMKDELVDVLMNDIHLNDRHDSIKLDLAKKMFEYGYN